jgi:hypothetical protein
VANPTDETGVQYKKGTEWPPPNWVDDFKPPKHAVYKFTNKLWKQVARENATATLEEALARSKLPPSAATASQDMCLLFSSNKEVARTFHPKKVNSADYGMNEIPDNHGICKKMFVHTSDLFLINEIKKHYGSCGLEYHKVPHPVMPLVFCIVEIYVYSGNEIAGEVRTKTKCLTCGRKNAGLQCSCQSVFFCSLACKERALVEAKHLPSDCELALRKVVGIRAIEAKNRMIGFNELITKQPDLAKQIAVVPQSTKKAGIDTTQMSHEEYMKQKRARLAQSSAEVREKYGMAVDPNIAPVVAEVATVASEVATTSTSTSTTVADPPN